MRTVDVVVVGAGPAGISAAIAAASTGAQTVLIDENDTVGGQLRWRIGLPLEKTGGLDAEPGPGHQVAQQLAQQMREQSNLTVETSTVAWGLFDENILGISQGETADEVQASSIVLATGSTDIALPFPGWTLPGVMTARAVQIFMHVHRVIPGWRWAILGDSEEADELAHDLERTGAEVIVRCRDVEQLRASGTNRLAHVEVGEDVHEVDSLAIALGRQPDAELAFHAKAESAFVLDIGGFTARRDQHGQTSESGVYIAGDAAGIATLPELVAEGRLAGLAAAGADETALAAARETLDNVMTASRRAAISQLQLVSSAAGA